MRRNQRYYWEEDARDNRRQPWRQPQQPRGHYPAQQRPNGWSVVVFIGMLIAIGVGLAIGG